MTNWDSGKYQPTQIFSDTVKISKYRRIETILPLFKKRSHAISDHYSLKIFAVILCNLHQNH
jgi:hypothetical protein